MKTSLLKTLVCCAASSLAVTAFGAGGMLKHHDSSFVEKAAKSGMAEVDISKIAAERSTNPQVKEFAQMMVSDHGNANTELTALAGTKGVTLPMDKTNVEKWSQRSAKDFDQEYMDKMVKDHEDAVSLFEKEAKNGDDMDLKAFASKTLPTLQAHYAKAKEIKASLK
ncbi:MAG TPA: DUF4142 domain-containing protein [Opitutaceae bacterium]|nr:DUF4142 domain-containing protein [Opitutaceae bacterium]